MFLSKNDCEKFQNEVVVSGVSKESEHLKNCFECQEFIKFFHDMRLSARAIPEAQINPHVLTRLQAMAYEHVLRSRSNTWSSLFNWLPQLAPAMVVLILFMGFGYVMGAHQGGQVALQSGGNESASVAANSYQKQEQLSDYLKPVAFNPGVNSFQNVALDGLKPVYNDTASISFEKQLEEFRKLTMESDADTLLMRGRRLKAMGKVDQALKDFEGIMEFYPNYTYLGDVLMYRAQCYAILGKFDEAIGSLETYLEKNPAKRALIEPMINQISETRDDGQVLIN